MIDIFEIEAYPNYFVNSLGEIIRKQNNKPLKTFKNKGGYYLSFLYRNGKRHTLSHHRLVASLFHDNLENKAQVNHIDGDKSNNHPDNLEWTTAAENMNHSRNVLGNVNKGGDKAKLSFDIAKEIRSKFENGFNKSQLSREYKVTRTSITKILTHKSYKNENSYIK